MKVLRNTKERKETENNSLIRILLVKIYVIDRYEALNLRVREGKRALKCVRNSY